MAQFADRLEKSVVLGAWLGELSLCGIAGMFVPDTAKLRHKASIVGVYVRPEARGTGLAQALLEQLIAHANERVEALLIMVEACNIAALRLYRKLGFEEYGREPRALKVNGAYYDEILMTLPLSSGTRRPSIRASV
ncbi:hypothetical protein GCM10027278_20830 [Paralcaligenes ginsengisoli]